VKKNHKAYALGAAVAIVCISLGARIEHSSVANEAVGGIVNHAFTEVGIALLIAIILGLTFEQVSLREFQTLASKQQSDLAEQFEVLSRDQISAVTNQFAMLSEKQLRGTASEFRELAIEERNNMNKDIFQHLFGRSIPQVIMDELDVQFLMAQFCFSKFSMSIIMKPLHISVGSVEELYLSLEVRITYEVANLTSNVQNFDPSPRVLKLCPSEVTSRIKFTDVSAKGPNCEISLGETSLASVRFEDELSVQARVAPVAIPQKGAAATSVTLAYQTVTSYQHGYYLHVFPHHAFEVELSVDAYELLIPVSAQDFSGTPFRASPLSHPERYHYFWQSSKPFLASQGFYIAWGTRPI
jgi:hypothetical protein